MADGYDALLLRLIGALETNTKAARWEIYGQARDALSRQFQSSGHSYTPQEIITEQLKLGAAINRVESQYGETYAPADDLSKGFSQRAKTTIALLGVATVALLVGVGYLYFIRAPNSSTPTTAQKSTPQLPNLLDRDQAFKVLASSTPVFKDFPLAVLGDALQSVFWNTGLFDTMTSITTAGGAKFWLFTLKERWRPFCTIQNVNLPGGQYCKALVSTRTVSQVTGIAGDRTSSAQVDYIVTQKQTPFGTQVRSAFERLNPYELREFQESNELYVAQLLHYDDGWRVQHVERKQ